MTREEAIQILADLIDSPFLHTWEKQNKALHMAIEALSADTSSDLISRANAIRWVKTECNPYGKPTLDYDSGLKVIEHLKKMPSELPSTEAEWIPCSERLPEEKKDVLIAFKHNMAVGFWEDILDNGKPVWYANSGDGWMTDTESVDNDGIPIAWMPLPKPYREEGKI